MSFINKVKNFFYEDVEEDEEYELNEMRKREEKERKRLEKLREKQRKQEEKIEISNNTKIEESPKEELTERELFKSEKTFNFPMDIGDDIFDDTIKMEPVEEKKKEVKEYKTSTKIFSQNKPSTINEKYENISKYQKEDPNSPKKFKPSPVVSPVYGILDKNYTVEEVVEKKLSKTKEFSIDKKIVDFDSVRNRAYKELDEEIEKTLTGTKDIFYNLEEDKKEEEVNDYSNLDNLEDNSSDVIITYDEEEDNNINNEEINQEEVEEKEKSIDISEEEDFEEPDVEIPIVKKRRTSKKEKTEKNAEKEDLFNLIDNMYKDDDEEEED